MRITNTRMPIHFMPGRSTAVCGEYAYAAGSTTLGSIDPSEVTCARCMGTDTYMGAALVYRAKFNEPGNGLTVEDKVAIGQVSNSLASVIEELDAHLDALDKLDCDIKELEYALRVIGWWEVRYFNTRRRWKKQLRDLKRERGY